jgi:hypothetical protein
MTLVRLSLSVLASLALLGCSDGGETPPATTTEAETSAERPSQAPPQVAAEDGWVRGEAGILSAACPSSWEARSNPRPGTMWECTRPDTRLHDYAMCAITRQVESRSVTTREEHVAVFQRSYQSLDSFELLSSADVMVGTREATELQFAYEANDNKVRSWARLLFAEGRGWTISCDAVEDYYESRDAEIFKQIMERIR